MDNTRFEDYCRNVLGNKSFPLFTVDKIITQSVKHLQAMCNDENVNKLIGLFVYHRKREIPTDWCGSATSAALGTRGSTGRVDPVLYRKHVAQILCTTMEDVYAFQVRLHV